MSPQISIIIPVYKVEPYLSRCIDSILVQNNRNFELLLIDDGSPDNSGVICDQYAEKDSRITVFHKENGGVSSARNIGLDNARGEWIAFIDADDYISQDFLFIPQNAKCDVIQKSHLIVNENNKVIHRRLVQKNSCYNNQEDIYLFFANKRTNALWNKIIARNVIKEKRFKEDVSIGEDFLFFLSIIKDIHSYSFSTVGSYYYLLRNESAMQKVNKQPQKRIKVLIENINNVRELTSNKELYLLQCAIIYSTYVYALLNLSAYVNSTERKITKSLLKEMQWSHLKYLPLKIKLILYLKKLWMNF